MISKRTTLQAAGVVSGLALCGSVYFVIGSRRKDKLATALLDELNKFFNPESAGLSAEEAFDIHYADQVLKRVRGTVILLKTATAQKYADTVYDSLGFFFNNTDKLYGVFHLLADKVQVSQVAKAYFDKHHVNLIDALHNKLSKSEASNILSMVRGLPGYRVVNK